MDVNVRESRGVSPNDLASGGFSLLASTSNIADFRGGGTCSPAIRTIRRLVPLVAIVLVGGACRDRSPTETAHAIGLKPLYVCYTGGGSACICFPGSSGTWPDCTEGEAPPPPPVVTGDTAAVFCLPRSVARGAQVSCRIYIGRQRVYQVMLLMANGVDRPFQVRARPYTT